MKLIARILVAISCAAIGFAQTGNLIASEAPQGGDFVMLAPVEKAGIKPGVASTIALHFRVVPGMHINSHQPTSELLIPTTLKLSAGNDLGVGAIHYPAGQRFSLPIAPDEKLSVYSHDFTITARVSATRTAMPGNFTVHGELRYQACDDRSCFPPKTLPVQFDVKVVNATAVRHGHPALGQSPHIRR